MKNLKARIHSFESFGAVDGPGIRFVIFMQGCHLKCQYCHNRDSWDVYGGKEYSLEFVLNKIIRYQSYMQASNGGVTISGGEPLLQADFILALLQELKKYNIHTAIDTSGCVPLTDKIKKIMALADLFLLDIKCIDDEKCKKLSGVSNKLELEFAHYLNSIRKPMWIRQVLVPGITDIPEDLEKLKSFLSEFNNIEKIEILPYHDIGKFKWEQLGYIYPLEGVRIATSEDVENIIVIRSYKA